ncbi:MAG: hypothetical protein ACP5R5_14800 [Armatimonadota bacterium]
MSRLPGRAIATGVVALVVLAAVALYVPYDIRTYLGCPYCGASAVRRRVLLVPVSLEVREGPLTRYWRIHVEPGHVHTWVLRETFEHVVGGGTHRSHPACLHARWFLKDQVAVAVLRALPSGRYRRKLMDAVSNGGNDTTRIRNLCMELRMAYEADPARRDWPAILRKNGVRL